MKKLHFKMTPWHVCLLSKNLNKSNVATNNKSNKCLGLCHNASLSLVDMTQMFDKDTRNLA